MRRIHVLFLCIFFAVCKSEEKADSVSGEKIFRLGVVEVVALRSGRAGALGQSSLTGTEIVQRQRLDVSHALDLSPGVTLTNVGGRNESMVYVRGFDLRQVPVYLDGIPVYIPYDGYIDLSRFTTFDLGRIDVSKGFSSMLQGPNALGGTINLVTKKPTDVLEYSILAGVTSGYGYTGSAAAGMNNGQWYAQGSVSILDQKYYPLSDQFNPSATENGGWRDNSYRSDQKIQIRAGLTPVAGDEYSFTWISQHGRKGTPLYTGTDTRNKPRYWQWPRWDKSSYYLNSSADFGNILSSMHTIVSSRFYYDQFASALYSYDDALYTSQSTNRSYRSFYDDDTFGGSLEAAISPEDIYSLKVALNGKLDRHREHNEGEPWRTFRDGMMSIGGEIVFPVSAAIDLSAGISYDVRKSISADNYNTQTKLITDFPVNDAAALNEQCGIICRIDPYQTFTATIARRSRFPTMKDRYSYRLGLALPNPALTPEYAMNYTLAYSTLVFTRLRTEAEFFYNAIADIIQRVDNVQPGLYQFQNTGRARYYGAELTIELWEWRDFRAATSYMILKRENITAPSLHFTDTPVHTLQVLGEITPLVPFTIGIDIQYNSQRYSTSDGIISPGFVTANLSIGFIAAEFLSLHAGINNIFDRNYTLMEGYPEPGRNYFISLQYH